MVEMIIGLCGRKAVGKSTFACFGNKMLLEGGVNSANISFAYPIKKILIDSFGIPEEYVFGNDKKKSVSFGTWGDFFPNADRKGLASDSMDVREMLTYLGTDIFRNQIDRDFWKKAFLRRIDVGHYDDSIGSGKPEIIFVTDVRYENEVDAILGLGGIVVKLERNLIYGNHETENAVDRIPENLFWRIYEHSQIHGINNLKLQVSAMLYRLEIV